MTRGKWVAMAVGVAVIAVLVPYGPELWMAVAYTGAREELVAVIERGTTQYTPYTHIGPIEFTSAYRSGSGTLTMVGPLTIKRKRHAWIPGEEFIVPDQECPWCERTSYMRHEYCFTGRGAEANCGFRDGTRLYLPETFRCTCPHPSHAQESE